ncbi:Crp/Fnr family transcriptional regulator [Neptunomonas sp.]|uniref:Crp/Fnr family transcriptional regulator n=1 Tax=Neptunomonas sp. TaxID=1971898 RepID=UPI0025F93582|nr:Crp/Fnr family transcriptional regulator [Neptunomonas sp.]
MNDILGTLPFIDDLNAVESQRLSNAQLISMEEGAVLLRQGDTCKAFLILIEGSVRVFGRSSQGRELEMYRIERMGTCVLTTSCLLAGQAYPAEAVVESDARLLLIKDEDFSFLMSGSAAFRSFVFDSYSERLSSLFVLIQSIAFEKIEIRLTRYLLQESRRSLVLSVSHQHIADALGTAREVISRHLKIMEQQQWLALSRGQIMLLAPLLMKDFLKEQDLM